MASDSYSNTTPELSPGCNVILWDTLLSGFGTFYMLYEYFPDIHIVFDILGGLLGAVLFFILTQIRYINFVVLLLSCIAYGLFISQFLIECGSNIEGFDDIWKWAIRIVVFLLVIVWHIGSHAQFDITPINQFRPEKAPKKERATSNKQIVYKTKEDLDCLNNRYTLLSSRIFELLNEFDETVLSANAVAKLGVEDDYLKASIVTACQNFSKLYEEIYQFNEKLKGNTLSYAERKTVVEEIDERYASLEHIHLQLMKETQQSLKNYREYQTTTQSSSAGCDESLFYGCDNKEALTKRYKNLMKIYHPDNISGDVSMTQKIQFTYEKLLQKYQNE